MGFSGDTDGKESACSAGDLGSIPGLGRLEKGMATHSSILAWRIYGQRSLVGYSPWGRKEPDTTERLTHTANPVSLRCCLLPLESFRPEMGSWLEHGAERGFLKKSLLNLL